MGNVYIAMETLASVIILILIYANICEVQQHSKKRNLFTKLLIANEIVVVADTITWMRLDWNRFSAILSVLICITYIVPTIMQIFFALYLYEHISLKVKVSKKPFKVLVCLSVVEGLLTLMLCISGKLYSIQNGKYYPGKLEGVYYLLHIISVLALIAVILLFIKRMSFHDMLAALSFCLVPYISIALTVATGLNVSVTLMSVSMLLMYVMLQSENESFLYGRANLDELTGLFNRSAYEDEILNLSGEAKNSEYVYASIDVNGLKVVNDTLGHAAGDELICGAAKCLKAVFGKCGKVFRTGGDEFVSIFYADADKLAVMKRELETTSGNWKGKIVDSLALSVGYVSKKNFRDMSVLDIAKLADKRMYDEKTKFYASKGVDRKGQNEAHKVLCSLYTKILKINITEDTFSIINMIMDEQIKEKGYADRISEWLEGFGKSGQVHPEDLEEFLAKTNLDYMKEYFKSGKTSLSIMYRRKYDTVFKQVMMEIIPTKEYSDSNQSLYLYVKSFDI